jgi:zinc protease
MLQLPTDKAGLVDKGLLVMQDWAGGITFENSEIDKERGVIESEWRTGLGASERMRQIYWPKLFYKSRYANRLPIGLVEIIKTAPYDRFRQFYKDWYRPNLMALVVVGDINVDEIEEKVKKQFAQLQNPANPREKKQYEVPGHDETFISIAKDKEASAVEIEVLYKHPPMPTRTLEDYRTGIILSMYRGMFADRIAEITNKKDAPFLSGSASFGDFVRGSAIYSLSAGTKETGLKAGLEAILTENARVMQHGFTESELARQRISILKAAEKRFNERDKNTSASICGDYVQYFLEGNPALNPEKRLQLIKEFLPTIKLEEINKYAKQWTTDKNRSVIVSAPDKASVLIPTEAEIRDILAKFSNIPTEPYKDKYTDMPLMPKEPIAGKVVETKTVAEVDVTEMRLSNGVRVLIKPTKFQNDQILMQAYSPGGHSLYSDKDFMSAQAAAGIVNETGIGNFDNIALDRKLTGKTVDIQPYIDELSEGFVGSSVVEDLETLLQLTHLYAVSPRKNKDDFDRVIAESKEQVKNLGSNPMYYFYDQMAKIQSTNHPRRMIVPLESDFDKVDFERAYQIYTERFADFSDFTFVFVGNIDAKTAQPLLEKYIASLPSKNRVENWKDVGVKIPAKSVNSNLKKGLAPQTNVYVGFLKDENWTREKEYQLNAAVRVLNIMVRENLREDKGGVYSPQVFGSFDKDPHGSSEVGIIFQCAPENTEKLVAAVKEEVKKLQTEGVSEDNFNKIREIQRRERETNLESNRFWRGAIVTSVSRKQDMGLILKYNEMVEKLTREDIKKAANAFMDLNKTITLTVAPEKEEGKKP